MVTPSRREHVTSVMAHRLPRLEVNEFRIAVKANWSKARAIVPQESCPWRAPGENERQIKRKLGQKEIRSFASLPEPPLVERYLDGKRMTRCMDMARHHTSIVTVEDI